MLRNRGAEMKSNSDDDVDSDLQRRIQEKEEGLKRLLIPLEGRIMSLQSVLVWEKPYHTAALFIAVNFLFWLGTTLRFYQQVGICGAVGVFVDMWANWIWPEIKVPPSPSEDSEGWTPVHPRLMGVPEICRYLAKAWVYTIQGLDSAIQLRKERPGKFFLFSILGCTCLAFFGCCIPGIYLLYFTVMGALLLPCVIYHNIAHIAYKTIEPYITNVENKMKIRRTKRKKKSKKGKHKRTEMPHSEMPSIQISDSDEEEIKKLLPDLTPKVKTAPATGASDLLAVDDDDEHTGLTPGHLTPQMPSISASRDISDDDFEPSIGVSEMPSYDALDDSSMSTLEEKLVQYQQEDFDNTFHNEPEEYPAEEESLVLETQEEEEQGADDVDALDTQDTQDDHSPLQAEPIQFVSEHFKQPEKAVDNEEEEFLAQGLTFPDVDEHLAKEAENEPAYLAQSQLLSDAASKTSQVVSQTVSSLMAGTISGLNLLSQTVTKATTGSPTDGAIAEETVEEPESYKAEDVVDDDDDDDDDQESKVVADTKETEAIEAEFEFLTQDDFDGIN